MFFSTRQFFAHYRIKQFKNRLRTAYEFPALFRDGTLLQSINTIMVAALKRFLNGSWLVPQAQRFLSGPEAAIKQPLSGSFAVGAV